MTLLSWRMRSDACAPAGCQLMCGRHDDSRHALLCGALAERHGAQLVAAIDRRDGPTTFRSSRTGRAAFAEQLDPACGRDPLPDRLPSLNVLAVREKN